MASFDRLRVSRVSWQEVATRNATYALLSHVLSGGATIPLLCKVLQRHKSNVCRQVQKAEDLGFIVRIGRSPAVLEVTGPGRVFMLREEKNVGEAYGVAASSLGVRGKIRLHRLSIMYKILDTTGECVAWVEKPVKGWVKKYAYLDQDGFKFTIERTGEHIILYLSCELPKGPDFQIELNTFLLRVTRFADYWLRKRGVRFDDLSGKVLHQHLASEEAGNERVDPKTTVSIKLGRPAASFYPTDMKAEAWIDWSKKADKSILDLESNDLTYNEKLVMVPEYVAELRATQPALASLYAELGHNLQAYNENLKMHLEVMQDMRATLKEIRESVKNGK